MTPCIFTATIQIRGINPYVLVSASRAKTIKPGWRKAMPVRVRVNDQTQKAWPVNLMPVGDGSFYLYLSGDIRKASDTEVGDQVRIEIYFDSEYRNGPQHPMPAWFEEALHENAEAKTHWEALIPSRQKEILRYFAQLKSEEARARNLSRAIDVLSGQPGRFMAREWRNGA